MYKKKIVAMLLAGGQGSRLYALTHKLAKPAVSFGGKYRIIDFTLSNCVNSDIDTVGVLTQYQPLILNDYIGNGQPWDLDRSKGGVHILSPYQAMDGAQWYKGTANAIYQNIHFIESYDPEHVLILSGDHIYRMDYSKMLDYHVKKNADCTIAVLKVPMEEASRFGIMSVNENSRITEFAEKPKQPKSNLASMGIYIFRRDKLVEYLKADEKDVNSSNDFGKNIIVNMLNDNMNMVAYPFEGYWKDVGTITSLWEANMDLLGEKPIFALNHKTLTIYARNQARPPHYLANEAIIKNSLITEGCEIYGTVENSVLSQGVVVAKGAVVRNSVIMSNVKIGENCVIDYTIIDEDVKIENNSKIGDKNSNKNKISVVGRQCVLPEGTVIPSGVIINSDGTKGA